MTPLTLSLLTFVALVGLIGAAVAVVTRSRPPMPGRPPPVEDCWACEMEELGNTAPRSHTCHGIVELRSPAEAEVWHAESRAREGR